MYRPKSSFVFLGSDEDDSEFEDPEKDEEDDFIDEEEEDE